MKKNVMIAAVLLFIFAQATTVFSESATSRSAANVGVLMLQQQLQAMQMAYSDPAATYDMGADAIVGIWSGKSPTMTPAGNCTTTTVEVKIEKQCGKLVQGYIKALGVQVPVEGSFASNFLSVIGTKTGTVSWVAAIFAIYSPTTDSFTVQIFSFQKINPVPNNVYDTNWKLTK
jgi:hypothetical protein